MSQTIKEMRCGGTVPLLVDGDFVSSQTEEWLDLVNPATQAVISRVPITTHAELERALAVAVRAQQAWHRVPAAKRVRCLYEYQALLHANSRVVAEVLAEETGKTLADALSGVQRGIEAVEQACHVPALMTGEATENVATHVDMHSYMHPLGVCVGITPFNFPAMIPLWLFPFAIACGNSFILKPSEQTPLTAMYLAELFQRTQVPDGVLQVVHGDARQADALLEHEVVEAVSFVGSVPTARHVYRTGSYNLKRVQAFAGAKNHVVVMPDADRQRVLTRVSRAACAAAGQRCMAISVVVLVGQSTRHWVDDLRKAMVDMRPGAPGDDDAAFGPLISHKSLERVRDIIGSAGSEGADVLLDGTDCRVPGYPDGNWIGPTLLDNVTTNMTVYTEEVFGPVLCVMHVDTLDEAIALVNANTCGNSTAIFTRSGAAARKYRREVEVGQIGVNLPVPMSSAYLSFSGSKDSFFGDLRALGQQAVQFYTETRTVVSRWPEIDIDRMMHDG